MGTSEVDASEACGQKYERHSLLQVGHALKKTAGQFAHFTQSSAMASMYTISFADLQRRGKEPMRKLRSSTDVETSALARKKDLSRANTAPGLDVLLFQASPMEDARLQQAEVFVPAARLGLNAHAEVFVPPCPSPTKSDPMKVTLASLVDGDDEALQKETGPTQKGGEDISPQTPAGPPSLKRALSLADSIVPDSDSPAAAPSPAAAAWAQAQLPTPSAAQAQAAMAMAAQAMTVFAQSAQKIAAETPSHATPAAAEAKMSEMISAKSPAAKSGPPIISRSRLYEMLFELVESCCERQAGRWEKDYDLIDLSSDSNRESDDDDEDLADDKAEGDENDEDGGTERRDRRRKKQERRRRKKERERQWKEKVEQGLPTEVDGLDDEKQERRQQRRNRKIGILVSSIKTEWSRHFGSQAALTFYMSYFGLKKLKLLLLEVQNLMLVGVGGFMRVTTVTHAQKYCNPFPQEATPDPEDVGKAQNDKGSGDGVAEKEKETKEEDATEAAISPNRDPNSPPEVIMTGSRSATAHKNKYHLHRLLYSLIAQRCQEQQMAALRRAASEGNNEAQTLLDRLQEHEEELSRTDFSSGMPSEEASLGKQTTSEFTTTTSTTADQTTTTTTSTTEAPVAESTDDNKEDTKEEMEGSGLSKRAKPPDPINTEFQASKVEESTIKSDGLPYVSPKQMKTALADLLEQLPQPQGLLVSEIKSEWRRVYRCELQPLMEKVGCKKVSRLIHTVPGLRIFGKENDMKVIVIPKKGISSTAFLGSSVDASKSPPKADVPARPFTTTASSTRGKFKRTLQLAEGGLEPTASTSRGAHKGGNTPMTPFGPYPASPWNPYMTPGGHAMNNWFQMGWGNPAFMTPTSDGHPQGGMGMTPMDMSASLGQPPTHPGMMHRSHTVPFRGH